MRIIMTSKVESSMSERRGIIGMVPRGIIGIIGIPRGIIGKIGNPVFENFEISGNYDLLSKLGLN